MANCEACEDLKEYAPNFVAGGITETECESLQENTGLNPKLSVLHTNCEDLGDMLDCLIGNYLDRLPAADPCKPKEYIAELVKNMYSMYKALICSDCGQWEKIEKLEDAIRKLAGGTWKTLTAGTHYSITYYNGFGMTSENIVVQIQEIFGAYNVRFRTASGRYLTNPNLLNMRFRHTSEIADVPECRIFSVRFIGDYAFLNNYNMVETSDSTNGIWNVQPLNIRASWAAACSINHTYMSNNAFLVIANSYADGYNTQFSQYSSLAAGATIYSNHINLTVNCYLYD